jgi:hypothetical protein
MATPARCEVPSRSGIACTETPAFGVYWQTTGADEITACPQHLAKAARILQSKISGSRQSTFKLRILPTTTTPLRGDRPQ